MVSKAVVMITVALAVPQLAGCSTVPAPQLRPFALPGGPYGVGTTEFDWTDHSRREPFSAEPHARRRLTVQVWYPTQAVGDPAAYLRHPAEYEDQAVAARLAKRVFANAVADVAVAATGGRFPVVLYNHGFHATRWSATFAVEMLASHGFIVVAPEYFGAGSETIRYLDGSPYRADAMLPPKETGRSTVDIDAFGQYLEMIFPIWRSDATFVLDKLTELDAAPGPLNGRLDLARIGTVGSSFGGALSLELAARDRRIKGAIDYDGMLFGDVVLLGAIAPVLMIKHEWKDDAAAAPKGLRGPLDSLRVRAETAVQTARGRSHADWYSVLIPGSQHLDFSDYPLLEALPRPLGTPGVKQVQNIVNAYTLAFFERYLRDTRSDILQPAHAIPGAVLTVTPAPGTL